MQKKEDRLEVFKSALISTIKSISETKDCEIKFGKSNLGDNNKVVNLFQGALFCGACGGRIDVVNKKRFACVKKGEKYGLKEEVSYRQMFCQHMFF